jgi:hypothetical protein
VFDGRIEASDRETGVGPKRALVGGSAMLSQLVPRQLDNDYRGRRLALWLFGLVLFVNVGISISSIANGREIASSTDGIPLDALPAAGAAAVVSLFGLLGLWRLIFCVLCVVVLARYRAMVPIMFALLLLEQLGRRTILWEHLGRRAIVDGMPIIRSGTSPDSFVSVALFTGIAVGLAMSVVRSKRPPKPV